jgi:hypothetical protein
MALAKDFGEKRSFEDPAGAITQATVKLLRSKVLGDVPGREDRPTM